jgi:Predicted ornithine cyclodeaminase, mu-crystallin homolog
MNDAGILLLNASDVMRAAPSLETMIGIVEETYRMEARGEVDIPPKVGIHPHDTDNFLHAMPAWVGGANAVGMKWVSFFPGNAGKGTPIASATIVLNDIDTGLPIALIEGMWITNVRTGACAALAAKHYGPPEPRRLGLVGCGSLAEWSLRCISEIMPTVTEVFVASARPESRRSFCESMARSGPWNLTPVGDVREAVEGMDIVVSAVPKLAAAHPIKAEWWTPGTLMVPLDVTGAWDDQTYAVADRLACDHRANLERALARYRPGILIDESRLQSMQEVIAGRAPGRLSSSDRTLAFITGIGSIDVAVAQEVYRRAVQAGIGTRFSMNL